MCAARTRLRERVGDRSQCDTLQHGGRVHLGGRRRDQHGVGISEVPAPGELLAKRRERERHRAPDALGVRGGQHRLARVRRPVRGPAQRLKLELGGTAGDRWTVGLGRRHPERGAVDGLPLRHHRQRSHDLLGDEVARRAAEVVVEDGLR